MVRFAPSVSLLALAPLALAADASAAASLIQSTTVQPIRIQSIGGSSVITSGKISAEEIQAQMGLLVGSLDSGAQVSGTQQGDEGAKDAPLDPQFVQQFQQVILDRRPSAILKEWAKPDPLPSADDPELADPCLLYTSPSPRDGLLSRMPSSA